MRKIGGLGRSGGSVEKAKNKKRRQACKYKSEALPQSAGDELCIGAAMAMISRGRSSAVMLVLAIFLVSICCVCAESHTVGGSDKWALNVNYTDWAKGETFTVGDTLTFEWTGTHDVAEVNSSSEYAACTSSGSVNGTSPVTHTLSSAKTYYYICTVDSHCTRGMKLAVPVSSNSSTSSPSSASRPLSFFHVASFFAPIVALFLAI